MVQSQLLRDLMPKASTCNAWIMYLDIDAIFSMFFYHLNDLNKHFGQGVKRNVCGVCYCKEPTKWFVKLLYEIIILIGQMS